MVPDFYAYVRRIAVLTWIETHRVAKNPGLPNWDLKKRTIPGYGPYIIIPYIDPKGEIISIGI